MTLVAVIIWSLIHRASCQKLNQQQPKLSDWTWYEDCCVNDSVTGRGKKFAVSKTLWLDVVRGLLCQWLSDWTWYEFCCDDGSVTGRGTRFAVSMTQLLDVVQAFLCQWLFDWTWYEVCCVNDSVTGQCCNQRVYIHISMHHGRTSPYCIRQVDISGN